MYIHYTHYRIMRLLYTNLRTQSRPFIISNLHNNANQCIYLFGGYYTWQIL